MIPIPIGARVHHVSCTWNVSFSEKERREQPSWGWGTVESVFQCTDGTFEYKVKKDAPFAKGMSDVSWWSSTRIDKWEIL